jgi:ATP-dependent DNA ligase
VIDGEVVASYESGRPDFNMLQNFRSAVSRMHYFVFDVLVYEGRDLTRLPLIERREIIRSVLKFSSPRIRVSDYVEASATHMFYAVRQQGLEGIIGKRKDSLYEPGKRSGTWIRFRVSRGQELVVGGYLLGTHGPDSIIVGYYANDDLIYVARVRNGFVPASRRQMFEKLRSLEIQECPFVNLPDTHRSRWGKGLTAQDMKKCDWVRPELVSRVNSWNGPKAISRVFEVRRAEGRQGPKDRGQGTGGRSLSERDAILSLNRFKSLTAL